MAEAKTYDEKIIKGIEQILTDYPEDFFIQAHVKQGESFYPFDKGDESGSYCLQRGGIHYFSSSGEDGGGE